MTGVPKWWPPLLPTWALMWTWARLFQTPEECARQAIENDVHAVGVSTLGGRTQNAGARNHQSFERRRGADDIIVFVGGVIPRQDYDMLFVQRWCEGNIWAWHARSPCQCARTCFDAHPRRPWHPIDGLHLFCSIGARAMSSTGIRPTSSRPLLDGPAAWGMRSCSAPFSMAKAITLLESTRCRIIGNMG